MSYRQLTRQERYQIEALQTLGASQRAIARRLGRHPATISRELRRSRDPYETTHAKPYSAARAARLARQRRIDKGARSRKIQGKLRKLVEQKLRLSWSPEQISGRLKLELGIQVSHETIYQHVLRDSRRQGYLRYCLRFGGYKHHRFKKSRVGERTRLRKNWIDQRPADANERAVIGHWERDCVLGKRGGSALLTLIDRRSRYTRIRRVPRVATGPVAAATLDALAPHRHITRSLTNDNGAEFQRDQDLQARLATPIYFTNPSSPWQRGSIENLNGLVRQYVPKHADLSKYPGWLTTALEQTLNLRPRKTLGYRTPHEVFYDEELALTGKRLMRFGLEFNFLT